jgi:hypothetical protein
MAYKSPSQSDSIVLDRVGIWSASMLRAVLRNASFPTSVLDSNYLNAVHAILLNNLVRDQVTYLLDEKDFNHKADARLERWSSRLIFIGALSAVLYLVTFALLPKVPQLPDAVLAIVKNEKLAHVCAMIASTFGILMPTAAATCSAIRHYGDYSQIASRYQNAIHSLKQIEHVLLAHLEDRRRNSLTPSSDFLSKEAIRATDILADEVKSWNRLLRKKEIEVS